MRTSGSAAAHSPKLRCFAALAVSISLSSFAAPALARSAGVVALGCDTCHRDGKAPTVTLTATPPGAAVGEPITLTVDVSQANGAVAGFYLTTVYDAPGSFQAIEAGTVATSSSVMHTMPRTGSAGKTTFTARWTATQPTGVAFVAYALSANADRSTRGDGAGASQLELLVGCDGGTYYIDQDGDGHGSTDPVYPARKECTTPPGYAPRSGDCDDFRAEVYPDAAELCDLRDNDCDGNADEDVVERPFCEDRDGDGHGSSNGAMKIDCKPSTGFATCDADCDDRSATDYPGASEVCDGRDNNCDGKVDEGVRRVCGVGLCSRYAAGCTSTCTPGEPFVETCNGYDDDCDGVVDNGAGEALCGEAGLACLDGECVGPGSGTGGRSAGGSGNGGAAVRPGLASAEPSCAVAWAGRAPRSAAAAFVVSLLALVLARRRRGPRVRRVASAKLQTRATARS